MPPRAKSSPRSELKLRVILQRPPAGVRFCIQGKPGEFFDVVDSTGADLAFDFSVQAAPNSTGIGFLGPLTQGPPAARFVYIGVGTLAGQADSCWTRRIKISLVNIPQDLVERALSKGRTLRATFAGTGRDGSPACATIHPLDPGWQFVNP